MKFTHKIPAPHDRSMTADDQRRDIKTNAEFFQFEVMENSSSRCYFTDRLPRRDSKVWDNCTVWDNKRNEEVLRNR
jgi:hypothetical protein